MSEDRVPYTTANARHALDRAINEDAFQAQVIQLATVLGWRHIYHTHDSRRSQAGFPDLVMIRDRRILYAELKSERGRVSEAQVEWLDALNQTGSEWYVWRPHNWDQIVKALK